MSDERLEPLKCKNCGAPPISTTPGMFRCEHCGSVYRDPQISCAIPQLVTVNAPHCVTLAAKCIIPDWERGSMPAEALTQHTLLRLRLSWSKDSAACCVSRRSRIRTSARRSCATIVRGTVRIVPPDHRF